MTPQAGRERRPARPSLLVGAPARGLAAVALLFLWGGAPGDGAPRGPGAPPAAAPDPHASDSPSAAPRDLARDVRAAIDRVFHGTLVPRAAPDGAFPGDFNGDGREDLAAVATPADGAIAALNDELANWIVRDVRLDPASGAAERTSRSRVGEGDLLLAIIPGVDEAGWRNPEVRHAYLLRNAVGTGMRVRPARDLVKPGPGEEVVGDVIVERLAGVDGFLYSTGARYVWQPLRR